MRNSIIVYFVLCFGMSGQALAQVTIDAQALISSNKPVKVSDPEVLTSDKLQEVDKVEEKVQRGELPKGPVVLTMAGEIIETDSELRNIIVRHGIRPRGQTDSNDFYERVEFYADEKTRYSRKFGLYQFENLRVGDQVVIEYTINVKTEKIIVYVERDSFL